MQNINNQMQNINNTSLAKIFFYKDSFDEFVDELDFYNIIFAANGQFIALKSDFGISIDKIDSIKYTNSQLLPFESNMVIYSFVPKPSLSLFIEILEIFKYIYKECKAELCINVYYDKKENKFHLNIINQIVTSVTTEYKYDEKFEMSEDYIRYLQIHSHNSIGANFSARDDHDEKLTALCYYGVVGKISESSEFYNVESKFRIWNGIRFIEISLGDVFDLGVESKEIDCETILKLDSIIEISKQEIEKKKNLSKHKNINLNHTMYDFESSLFNISNLLEI